MAGLIFKTSFHQSISDVIKCFKVETREDEEQNVKLQQTIDLLLAAGYFRARIKGLSPFDKVSTHRKLGLCSII